MANSQKRILVVGSGPAGAVTAFWLAKAGFSVVVAERASKIGMLGGQGIDVAGSAVEVVRRMRLLDEIKSRTTGEKTFTLVNDDGRPVGTLGQQSEQGQGKSLTQEIEIQRGTLASVFAEAAEADTNVVFRFETTVAKIQRDDNRVMVTFSGNQESEEFHCVIGADGIGSRLRKMTFPEDLTKACYNPFDVYCAFFRMKGDPSADLANARFQQAVSGRSLVLRPSDPQANETSCYMTIVQEVAQLDKVLEEGTKEEQKSLLRDMFQSVDGLAKRALEGLDETDDLYCTRIAQIKLSQWYTGRVALVGDAAYAPSPLTGEGTTLGIIGAYVLAGELATTPEDPPGAFGRYREKFEDFVAESQAVPLGGRAPKLINPQTHAAISALRTIFKVVAQTKIWKLMGDGDEAKFDLPSYEFQSVN